MNARASCQRVRPARGLGVRARAAGASALAFSAGLLPLLATFSALAQDVSLSSFGTVGYALSDSAYSYQRFISNRGSFKPDSVLGAQADVKLGAEFGATLQVKVAPSTRNDHNVDATVSWAFVSWRPSNDWLIRVGKQRIQLYLNSENYDVGVTYDFLRLPIEMYSLVPANDAVGVSVTKNWKLGTGELDLDVIWGKSSNPIRYFVRDDIEPYQKRGMVAGDVDFKGGGLALTYRVNDHIFKAGVYTSTVSDGSGQPLVASFPFVPVAPGIGYYQTSPLLPGPGLSLIDDARNNTIALGADVKLPHEFRVISEFARSLTGDVLGPDNNRGYVSVLKRIGKWTPYVTYSFLKSSQSQLDYYNAVNSNRVPEFIPGASQINAAQRSGADQILAYDQNTWAIGASYSFSATSKLKFEVQQTRIGETSNLVDPPAGGERGHHKLNVLSLAYCVVF